MTSDGNQPSGPAGAAENAITVENLRFSREARGAGDAGFDLRLPAWQVAAGEALALTGPSGCGKTTLLHLLAGILVPAGGQVEVVGHALQGCDDDQRRAFRREQIGLVFQDARLVPHLTVRDNILILFHRRLLAKLPAEAIARCNQLAEQVGIAHLLQRRADRLSRGEAQRAALARALIHRPQVILADEPTASLDAISAQLVVDLLEQLRQEQAATLIVASHDPRCLEAWSTHCDLPALLTPSASQGAR